MIENQIVAQPGLTPNHHFNCSALLKQMRWYTTGRAKHEASETDGILWRRSLSTVSEDVFLHQPPQHHTEQQLWLASSKCTTSNTSSQPWPLPSYYPSQVFGKYYTLDGHGQKGGCVCTGHPAQQGQQCKTWLRASPVRLVKSHMPSQRIQLIWRRWRTTFKAEPQQLWKAIQVSSVWPSTGSKNHLNPPGKWPGLCYLYWLHPSTSSCFPCHRDVFLLSFTVKTAHNLGMDRRMNLASNLASRLARSITVFYGYNCRLQDQIRWIVICFYIHHTSRTKVNWLCSPLAEKLWLWYSMCM